MLNRPWYKRASFAGPYPRGLDIHFSWPKLTRNKFGKARNKFGKARNKFGKASPKQAMAGRQRL